MNRGADGAVGAGRERDSESGSATIYMLAGCLLVGLASLVPLITGAVVLARHTAAVAADAAALAGASTADVGGLINVAGPAAATLRTEGCRRAVEMASADHARLVTCVLVPCGAGAGSLQVVVRVAVGWAGVRLPGGGNVTEVARAGDPGCLPKSPP